MKTKCRIQWIDAAGKPTPDDRDAIGTVYRGAYFAAPSRALPNGFQHDRTESFPICAEHAKQLSDPEMCHWVFEPLMEVK